MIPTGFVYAQPQVVGSGTFKLAVNSDLVAFSHPIAARSYALSKLGHDDFWIAELDGIRCVALYSGPACDRRDDPGEVEAFNAEFGL